MTSPLLASGLLLAGFLLGLIPPWLIACQSELTSHCSLDGAECLRRTRRCLFIPAIFLLPMAGIAVDFWGPKEPTIAGLMIVALGSILLGFAPAQRSFATNVAGISVGLSLLAAGAATWMSFLAGAGRIIEGMSLGFLGIGAGYAFGPWLADKIVRLVGLRFALLTVAILCLIAVGILAGVPDADLQRTTATFFSDLRFWLLALVLSLYFPVESCLAAWTEPFLRELGGEGESPNHSRAGEIGFQISHLLARLAVFWFLRPDREPWILIVCALTGAMALGNLVGAYGRSSGTLGVWLAGACYGPLLPGFLGMLCVLYPHQRGVILGIALSAGCLFHAVLGPILRRHLLGHSPRAAMRVPMLLTLILTFPLLMVVLLR